MNRLLAVFLLLTFVSACENAQFRAREAGALGGAALGAGLGAIVGNQTGDSGAGIAIGAGLGALSGGLIGQGIDDQDDAISETDRRIEERDRELKENQRLINELRSRGVEVRSSSRGIVASLPDVLFEFDSSRLTPSAGQKVEVIADVIRQSGPRHVSIEGHTDSVGTFSYNQRLSEERARSVGRALSQNGIPRGQMSVHGMGERDPITSNSSESGRRKNRRVEVIIEKH